MTRNRIIALLATLLLLIVVGILASCEAFDAVTGGITKPPEPVDSTQPVATRPVPEEVKGAMAMVAAVEKAVADADTDLAKAEAEFAASGNADMAAEIARLRKHRGELATYLGIVRTVAQAMVSGLQNSAGKPAEVVVRETFGPIADLIPGWGGLAVGIVGGVLGLIQRARKQKALADAAANEAKAINLIRSVEAVKLGKVAMGTDEARGIMRAVQTPETRELVKAVTATVPAAN